MPKYKLDRETVYNLYINQKKSAVEISKLLGIKSSTTIYNFMRSEGIPRRKSTDSELRTENSRNASWKGCGELSGSYWYGLQFGAKFRNICFDIDIEYGWKLFLQQNRKCALSGIELNFWPKSTALADKKKQTASLDRIDSTNGYVEGNVQWIHKDINKIKMDFTQKEFIDLCKMVTNYQESLKL